MKLSALIVVLALVSACASAPQIIPSRALLTPRGGGEALPGRASELSAGGGTLVVCEADDPDCDRGAIFRGDWVRRFDPSQQATRMDGNTPITPITNEYLAAAMLHAEDGRFMQCTFRYVRDARRGEGECRSNAGEVFELLISRDAY